MKKSLILLCVLFIFGCHSKKTGLSAELTQDRPNVIYILADDLGYGDVKCFNPNGKISTPNIDNMAKHGVMFTDAHTSSAVCTPTRYGILTGRYNWRTVLKRSVLNGYSPSLIKPNRITVATLLKAQDYATAFVGKWHLGWDWNIQKEDSKPQKGNSKPLPKVNYSQAIKNGPFSHGFDYSFGFSGSLDMPPYVYVENGMATQVPTKSTVSVDEKGFWRKGPTADDFNHTTVLQDLTDKAIGFIEQKANGDKPFFLYFPLPAPHTPILPTTEFLGKSNTNMYGDFVMQVDDVVGQIRETLRQKGIHENTILLFTSDNGCSPRADFEELAKVEHSPGYHFRGNKADIYEAGHRVPFIVEWPLGAVENSKVDHTICTTDFFASCAELTGYKVKDNEGEDSFSILPLIQGKAVDTFREYTVHHSINGSFAIRQGDWKLCFCPGSGGWSYPRPRTIRAEQLDLPPMQLFNLKEDIGETKNLIDDYPDKALELKNALAKIILDGRSTPGASQENDGMEGWQQIESIVH